MSSDQTSSLVGCTIGHYSLVALLGTGETAEVFRARDLRLRRNVAVKVLLPSLAADPANVTRFRSGVRRVAALRHPHIVPAYEFGEQDGLLYLVMSLEPESLRHRLLRHGGAPLPVADALAVTIQVASALEAAHAQGIVHRDVKPENILLDRDGRALLTDFFFARDLAFLRRPDARQTLSKSGLPVGTPEYMAPEQLRGGPIDQRADVYALGAVLYELLCGVVPHVAATRSPYEVAALSLTEPITPPSIHNPKVWPALDEVMLTALAREPDDRYASAAEFAVALREASKRQVGGAGTLPIFRDTTMGEPHEDPTTPENVPHTERRDPSNAKIAGRRAERPTRKSEPLRIFVSHSHDDNLFTARLVRDLRATGADVWVDQSDITYDDFVKRINEGLQGRQWLVLVMTPSSLRSRWVDMEVNAALKMVVSKRMRGVIPFVAALCPEELIPPMWATLHRYDASADYKRALHALLRVLGLNST